MTSHTQGERFQPLKQQERVERTDRRASIAQGLATRFHDEGEITEGFIETDAMIAGRGVYNRRKVSCVPGEFAGFDEDARNRSAMTPDKFSSECTTMSAPYSN